ncbi:hypothetical protein FRC10_004446 [Ceratobasidium sp. 414]|nr:hypothetical protein FRC10_004446 [Ceratobasidium sp. 414]
MDSRPGHKRPLSAIFIGNPANSGVGAPGSLSQLQTQTALQVATGGSGLPSPPATNSTASTGKESVPRRVRKTSLAFATVKSMLTGDRREHERERERERRRSEEDDMDDQPFEDEDHTARLSGPTASTSSGGSLILGRSTSAGARSTTSSGGFDRVRNLADRNRKVLDKLSSISSAASSRLGSPAPTDRVPLTAGALRSRDLSPMPPISNNTLFPPRSNVLTSGSSPRNGPIPLASPNIRHSRDLEPETPSSASRFSPADPTGGSSGKGPDPQWRVSTVARQGVARDSPRMREIEFKTDFEEPTPPKERERLYESQRGPAPTFTVSGEGSASGIRREGSVRVSFSRSRQEVDVDEIVGNENVPRQRVYSSESDDRSITPPADQYSRRHVTDPVPPTPAAGRGRRVSITEPNANKEREPLRTRAAAGTLGRQRNAGEAVIERTIAAARKSPVRARGALPSEFRSVTESKRATVDNKRMSLDGKRTFSRSSNSPELLRRESGYTRPATAGGSRSATVREPRRTGMHSRWASEDTSGDVADSPRPRYERRGGSIESPLALGIRSVASESFKAAGLTRRRDDDEPLSASTRTNDSRNAVDREVEQLREGIARVGVGDTSIGEEEDDEQDDDPRTPPANNRVGSRNIHQIVTSRPGTSSGNYIDDGPRTAPPALRTYRSLNTGLITPSGSGTIRDRGPTPVTPANLVSAASTEHVRLMLESFAMFESNLARLESNGGAVPELLQNADIVVQTSQSLNALLRHSAANAMSEQIEAEVEDRSGRELEIWKVAGGEFRDALKVCDELVRSMTNLLLGVGRVLKERSPDDEEHTRSSGRMSSSEIRSGRMSADGLRSGRMSAELKSGRMSAEGFRVRPSEGGRLGESSRILEERRNSEVRRSLDGDTLRRAASRELPRLHDPTRPQTSMSLLRERGRESPNDLNSARTSTTSSSHRFLPSQRSPMPANDADTSYDTDTYLSPSPATRQLGEHRRERVLSIPPRLEPVPSESIVHKAQAKATPTITRRPRINVGTIRGTAPFTTPAPAPAPTQLSTATAIGTGSPDKPQRSMSYSVSRTAGAATVSAMSGLQAQARKRTISAADPLEPEVVSPTEMSEGSATQRMRSTITRSRPSIDFSADEGSASGTERKPRRRMATELFT